MSPQMRAYLSTWLIADWRQYVGTAMLEAEHLFKRKLTADERKELRRWIFKRFKEGTAGSSRTAPLIWSVMRNYSGT